MRRQAGNAACRRGECAVQIDRDRLADTVLYGQNTRCGGVDLRAVEGLDVVMEKRLRGAELSEKRDSQSRYGSKETNRYPNRSSYAVTQRIQGKRLS